MAKTAFETVDQYLASQTPAARQALRTVRSSLRKALPKAKESISYQIPTYKLDGRALIYFAGWKEHYSLYPATPDLVARFEKELAPYEISNGTLRFPLTEPVPARLIERLAKFRAQEHVERAPAKARSKARAGTKAKKSSAKKQKVASSKPVLKRKR